MTACSLVMLFSAMPVHAQQTEQNATTASDDAFGRTVGAERSGLYSTSDVRGFNPTEAGNVRIDGLYYDVVNFLPHFLEQSRTHSTFDGRCFVLCFIFQKKKAFVPGRFEFVGKRGNFRDVIWNGNFLTAETGEDLQITSG